MCTYLHRFLRCALLVTCISTAPQLFPEQQPQSNTEQKSLPYTELSKHEEFLNCLRQEKYILVKFYASWCEGCHEVEPAFRHVSNTFSDRITPVAIDIDNRNFQREVERHVDRGVPTIVLLDQNGSELTKQIGSSDAHTLESFISHHINASSRKKSSDKSSGKDSSANGQQSRTIASITNYQEYKQVMQNNRNVAILLHADWCSPCKMFKPTFENMSKDNPDVYCCTLNIDLLQSDASLKNEIASHAKNGIPTTLFLQDGIVVKSITGSHPAESLEKAVKEAFGVSKKSSTQTQEVSTQQNKETSSKAQQTPQKQKSRRGRKRRR